MKKCKKHLMIAVAVILMIAMIPIGAFADSSSVSQKVITDSNHITQAAAGGVFKLGDGNALGILYPWEYHSERYYGGDVYDNLQFTYVTVMDYVSGWVDDWADYTFLHADKNFLVTAINDHISYISGYGPAIIQEEEIVYFVLQGTSYSGTTASYLMKLDIASETLECVCKLKTSLNGAVLLTRYGNYIYYSCGNNLYKVNLQSGNSYKKADGFAMGDVWQFQNSNRRYIYGLSEKNTLRVYDCKEDKIIKTVTGVGSYRATNSNLYYSKIVDGKFKIYKADISGANSRSIKAVTKKTGHSYEILSVEGSSVYYSDEWIRSDGWPDYKFYKYSTKTKNTYTISDPTKYIDDPCLGMKLWG